MTAAFLVNKKLIHNCSYRKLVNLKYVPKCFSSCFSPDGRPRIFVHRHGIADET